MRPAFDSTKQAAAFAVLLLFLLNAPWLAGRRFLPPREQAYASEGWTWGPYPWIQKQIFEETNDIDLAFVGSSRLMWGIDTPYIQQKLDERLGRKTVVRSICWNGAGFDSVYFVTKNLLEHRRVNTLVFDDESAGVKPNAATPNWFRWREDAGVLTGLPLRDKLVFYFAAVAGMPVNLLELLTPQLGEVTNSLEPNYYVKCFHAPNPETRLGSVKGPMGFEQPWGVTGYFFPYAPQTTVTAADVLAYSSSTASNFVFLQKPLPQWQAHFAREFGALAQSHGVRLVLLHLPKFNERQSFVVTEPCFWPDFLEAQVAMIGVPGGRLFSGLSEPDMEKLFWDPDPNHLNQNGQNYFTPLVTPALLAAYENLPVH